MQKTNCVKIKITICSKVLRKLVNKYYFLEVIKAVTQENKMNLKKILIKVKKKRIRGRIIT